MKQETVYLPRWAKVVRVISVTAGGLTLAAIVFIVLTHSSNLIDGVKFFWDQTDVTEWLRDIYFVLLLIPIRFIKKRKFVEVIYYAFAVIAIFRYGEVLWSLLHEPKVSEGIIIGLFIMSAIFAGIIISNALLVLKWEKFKKVQEHPAAAEASPESP